MFVEFGDAKDKVLEDLNCFAQQTQGVIKDFQDLKEEVDDKVANADRKYITSLFQGV